VALAVAKSAVDLECVKFTSVAVGITLLSRDNVASQKRKRKGSVILTKAVLKVAALGVCTFE
jgi:hypothetical protein